MAFTKIKFTSNCWNSKKNYGTNYCKLINNSGQIIFERNSTVVGTWGSAEYQLPSWFDGNMKSITFKRYIDTRSFGNASMVVELYDDILCEWKVVLNISSGYRTGNGWQTNTWSIGSSSYYKPPREYVKSININNKNIKLSTVKWTTPSLIFSNNNINYYGKLSTLKPSYKTMILSGSSKYYLVDKLDYSNYTLDQRYTYQAVNRGSKTFNNCENIRMKFMCTSRPEGSHKGNNGNRTGNIYVKIKQLNGNVLINKTFVMWNYLGGDSKKYINEYIFFEKKFYEPVIVEVSWYLDVGYYVAHIWGERYGVSVIDRFKLTIETNV